MSQTENRQIRCDPLQVQGQAYAGLGVIRALYNNGMRVFSGMACQNFWDIVQSHIIHMALHWAKQAMAKIGHAD